MKNSPVDTGGEGSVLATTWSRLGAYLFDLLLLAVPLYVVRFFVTGSWTMWPATSEELPPRAAVSALWLVPTAAYFVGLWTSRWKATLGMRLLRIRLDRRPGGGRLMLGEGFRRWVALTGPGLLLPFALLAAATDMLFPVLALDTLWAPILLITVLSSPTKQGLHDRFCWVGSCGGRERGAAGGCCRDRGRLCRYLLRAPCIEDATRGQPVSPPASPAVPAPTRRKIAAAL